jgi:hypothetical protein
MLFILFWSLTMKKNRLQIAALSMASLLLSACVVTPDPYYAQTVQVEPPPLRHEYPGYAPMADAIWLSGYWGWGGTRYEWVPGRWEAPRHGYRWEQHRWERDGDHWRQSGGRWAPDARQQAVPQREPQPIYRPERDNPSRRESGATVREVQPRHDSPSPPPDERAQGFQRFRQEHRDSRGPANDDSSKRPIRGQPSSESRPVPTAAPAWPPVLQRGQARDGDKSQDGQNDESRSRRRQRDDGH